MPEEGSTVEPSIMFHLPNFFFPSTLPVQILVTIQGKFNSIPFLNLSLNFTINFTTAGHSLPPTWGLQRVYGIIYGPSYTDLRIITCMYLISPIKPPAP